MVRIFGLTGSIGMGKSATATMFARAGIPVFDADREVHRLYSGEAAGEIEHLFPGTVKDGTVDRAELARRVVGNAKEMLRLEAIVHPLIHANERTFVSKAIANGYRACVLEVPLLLENGADERCDVVVVASCPAEIQRDRVLARPGMTPEKFEAIRLKQMPDGEKRCRAHAIVPTGHGFPAAEAAVAGIIRAFAPIPGRSGANQTALA